MWCLGGGYNKDFINWLNYTLCCINLVLNIFNYAKKINQNLTAEQKLILFEEGTELAGTSELNHEKEKGVFIVQIVELNSSILKQNMKVDQAGLHFMSLYLMYLKQKQIII